MSKILTASTVLARFKLTTDDISAIATEYVIDDVIDYINLEAGTSISSMAGTAGTKTVTVTDAQNAAIKLLLPIMLRDVKAMNTSNSTTLGPYSMSESISQQTADFQELLNKALRRLTGSSFERA